jgi:ATP/maltotriose-dependent transcriptional regulator MalT
MERHRSEQGASAARDAVAAGREAFARRAWKDAYTLFSSADENTPLGAEELEQLALAGYALNLEREPVQAWTRAHHAWLKRDEPRRAARIAFLQACSLFVRGEMAPAHGWIARGRRLIEQEPEESAEQGWLATMTGLPLMFAGENEQALPYFRTAHDIAERFDDMDLRTIARLNLGHTLIQRYEMGRGLALMDEAMVGVTTGEVNPLIAGIVYCEVIGTCQRIFDLRRAREWTDSLSRWCESQPDLVTYRGDCLVFRCEMLVLQGAWPDALASAEQACETLASQRAWATLGSAYYQLAEIHRRRGEFDAAEVEYRRANDAGRDPEPGMSLLRLAQGRTEAAVAGIRRVRDETEVPIERARVLPAYVEIVLSAGDQEAADEGARELKSIADTFGMQYLRAASSYAAAATSLARGDARAAIEPVRQACRDWQELDDPYDSARARVLMALAYRDLGDGEAAAREFDAARSSFVRLGAAADAERIDSLVAASSPPQTRLSSRELEVLLLVARGKTNRQISNELVLSENTVARHLQNIFAKLGVSSRTAATAFAFEHRLLS